ncbi:MAG: hypothetical protein PHW46_00195 [Candidatus Omnitrophica bacterium]|nr:hypothetical protein [Candidatus Omnitrophota bacterium]
MTNYKDAKNKLNIIRRRIFIKIVSVIVAFAFLIADASQFSFAGESAGEGIVSKHTLSPDSRLSMEEFKEMFEKGYGLLSHQAVNEYIQEKITEAGGIEKLRQREVLLCREEGRPQIPVLIVAIPDLFANRGQFAHVGLGKYNNKPTIYIDSKFYYDEEALQNSYQEIPKADKKQGARHEFDEIRGWVDQSEKLGIPLNRLRDEWIIGNPEAKQKGQDLHRYNEFNMDYLFDRYDYMLDWESLYLAYCKYGSNNISDDFNVSSYRSIKKAEPQPRDLINAYNKYGYFGALEELGVAERTYFNIIKMLPDRERYLTLSYDEAVRLVKHTEERKPFGTLISSDTAKNLILATLDTIPGFKNEREKNNIRNMARLYREYVIGYKPRDNNKYKNPGQQVFFYEVGGLNGLMANEKPYFKKAGSPAELLRLAIPELINLTNPDALDPLEVELSYWTYPENAKYHILQALYTIDGFKKAREQNDIKEMARLYRGHVIGYKPPHTAKYKKPGQTAFFREVGGLSGLMGKKRPYFNKKNSSAELLRLVLPELINLTNPNALDPLEIERHYWTDPENAKYHILQALDTIPGFREARAKNNIKKMVQLYRKNVVGYNPKDKGKYRQTGQASFFHEVGGLRGLMGVRQPYFSNKLNSPAELLRLAIPGLINADNPDALKPYEVERMAASGVSARGKGSPASLLETIKKDKTRAPNNLFFNAMINNKGISWQDVVKDRPFHEKTLKLEFEILVDVGIFVPVKGKEGYYIFSELMRGGETGDTKRMIDIVNGIECRCGTKGEIRPLNRYDLSKEDREKVKMIIKERLKPFKTRGVDYPGDRQLTTEQINIIVTYNEYGYSGALDRLHLSASQYYHAIKDLSDSEKYLTLTYDKAAEIIKHPEERKPAGILTSRETAKILILATLDTVPGFRRARNENNIKKMANLYREYVIKYKPKDTKRHRYSGQEVFFREVGGLGGLMVNKRAYLDKTSSPALLLRLALPEMIDLTNPDALDPLEVERDYWTDENNAKYHIIKTLETIPGFKEAMERNDIEKMAELYRKHVIKYKAKERKKYNNGQYAFFCEKGGLAGLMANKQEYFKKPGSPAELLRHAVDGLVDEKNPKALHPNEVEGVINKSENLCRAEELFAACLEAIKNDKELFKGAMSGEGITYKQIHAKCSNNPRTGKHWSIDAIRKKCRLLNDLGIFVPADTDGSQWKFSCLLRRGNDENFTKTMINAINDIRLIVGAKGKEHPSYKDALPGGEIDGLREAVKMTVYREMRIMRETPRIKKKTQGAPENEKSIVCHLISDTIISDEQERRLLKDIEHDMRDTKYKEKVVRFDIEGEEDIISVIRTEMEKQKSLHLGYEIKFDVAIHDLVLAQRINEKFGISAVAFQPTCGEFVNVDSILLVLEAVGSDDINYLREVFEKITGQKLSQKDLEITEVKKFIEQKIFALPAVKADLGKMTLLNSVLKKFILSAA